MSFRKIDVDAYDEDVLQDTELYAPDPREPAQVLSDTKQKQLAVRSALNKCVTPALSLWLVNLALQIVVSVLNSTKSTDVPSILRSLSQDEQDTLMKYVYKGMGMPGWGDVSGSVLLGWHEKSGWVVDRDCGDGMYRARHDRSQDCIIIPTSYLILTHPIVCIPFHQDSLTKKDSILYAPWSIYSEHTLL
ncbi:actin-related protein 2/3 complex subunit 5 [Boletus reticuloceps]|uniref:Actin-related protein 2/3 complex subunit 5 n=1 Tax=Boletus reticuloceps TaxID=495285 RepID=A0A8I2YWB6_9AGAM|nr:actin-related protein 2/3 complex subunit 5 [Boletus reticuloceps]